MVSQNGFFVTSDGWINRPLTKREAITPAEESTLQRPDARIHNYALKAGQKDLASCLLYPLGGSRRPSCGQAIDLAKVILLS